MGFHAQKKMVKNSLFGKGIIIGILLGLIGWSFFAFLNEGITRMLVMIGDKTGFSIFFDELFQLFIIFLILVIIIIVILGTAIGFKKIKQTISG